MKLWCHLQTLAEVFGRLEEQCEFHMSSVEYLGHLRWHPASSKQLMKIFKLNSLNSMEDLLSRPSDFMYVTTLATLCIFFFG